MPCLWFRSEALEAATFYTGIFRHGKILDRFDGPPGQPPIAVSFEFDGRQFLALNGNPGEGMNDSISFMVYCDDQAEIDRLWDSLLDGGAPMACGWLKDRFGVRWQIVPRQVFTWLATGTPEQRQRYMAAMQTMIKLDIATLAAAHAGP